MLEIFCRSNTVLHALALKLACNSRLFSENIYNGNAHQQLTRNNNNVRHLSPRIIFFIYVPVRKQGHVKYDWETRHNNN